MGEKQDIKIMNDETEIATLMFSLIKLSCRHYEAQQLFDNTSGIFEAHSTYSDLYSIEEKIPRKDGVTFNTLRKTQSESEINQIIILIKLSTP